MERQSRWRSVRIKQNKQLSLTVDHTSLKAHQETAALPIQDPTQESWGPMLMELQIHIGMV